MNIRFFLLTGLLASALFACSESSISDDITEPDITIATIFYNDLLTDFGEENETELKELLQKEHNQTILERITACTQDFLAEWTFKEQQEIAKHIAFIFSDQELSREEEKWEAETYDKYKMTLRSMPRSLVHDCLLL